MVYPTRGRSYSYQNLPFFKLSAVLAHYMWKCPRRWNGQNHNSASTIDTNVIKATRNHRVDTTCQQLLKGSIIIRIAFNAYKWICLVGCNTVKYIAGAANVGTVGYRQNVFYKFPLFFL